MTEFITISVGLDAVPHGCTISDQENTAAAPGSVSRVLCKALTSQKRVGSCLLNRYHLGLHL